MNKQKSPLEQFILKNKAYISLIGKGVDSQSALEMSFGKKLADDAYRDLAEIEKKNFIENPKNN